MLFIANIGIDAMGFKEPTDQDEVDKHLYDPKWKMHTVP